MKLTFVVILLIFNCHLICNKCLYLVFLFKFYRYRKRSEFLLTWHLHTHWNKCSLVTCLEVCCNRILLSMCCDQMVVGPLFNPILHAAFTEDYIYSAEWGHTQNESGRSCSYTIVLIVKNTNPFNFFSDNILLIWKKKLLHPNRVVLWSLLEFFSLLIS